MSAVDAGARSLIEGALHRTLFVEAGAGAGKTHELVQRVANLVASGVPITSIAAISFTEKAAAELRDRIRTSLETRTTEDPTEATNYRDALEVLDEAHIQTLHAFAQNLLSAHALNAGLPPVFEVVDEIDAAIDFDRRWGLFLDDLLSLPDYYELMQVACTLGITPDRLRDLAVQFHDHWDQLLRVEYPDESDSPLAVPDFAPLADALDQVLAVRGTCLTEGDSLQRHIEEKAAPARTALGVVAGPLAAAKLLVSLPKLGGHNGLGNKNNWRSPSKAQVLDLLGAAETQRLAAHQMFAGPVLTELCRLIRSFTLEGVELRRTKGQLEFHDLLVLASDLLKDHPGVQAEVSRHVRYLLVDEFQDTDPLQVDLAVRIAASPSDAAPADREWWRTDVEPGRLFFVGDPKQSIYRFRRANISLYHHARRRFADDVIELTENFRSVPPLLDWVNCVFEGMLGDSSESLGDSSDSVGEDRGGQAPWAPLHAHRARAIAGGSRDHPPVVLLGGRADPKAALAGVREIEARDIAEACRLAVSEWRVADDQGGGAAEQRPARYDDIAILLPTRVSLAALERALDAAAVPYRIESRSLLWATQEVRDLVSILRCIDDPSDEVALIAALRSPLLACTDRDLVDWRYAGGAWNFQAPVPETLDSDHAVVEAVAWLGTIHNTRWSQAVSVIAERVVRERCALELAFGRRRQRESWHRVRFFLDQARAFADRGGASLRHFVDWAERQATEGATAVETVVPETDDRAVRILTIHAAKGLEFPIVVVAGLNVIPRRWRPAEVLWPSEGPPEVSVGTLARPWHTPGYKMHRDSEIRMEQHEAARLLYVACTRARDHLVVSLHHKPERPTMTSCLAARLLPWAEANAHLSRRLDKSVGNVTASPEPPPTTPTALPVSVEQWTTQRELLVAASGKELAVSATAMSRLDDEDVQPWRRGRAGSAFGRAVHAVLQSIDLTSGFGVEAIAAAAANAEGIAGRGSHVAACVHAALGSSVVRGAIGARHWREVYVAVDIDGVIVDGYIDLLVETADGLVVIDYKTDALDDNELDAADARYRLQLATYAVALEANLDRHVTRAELLFISAGSARHQAIVDLDGAKAEVRASIEQLASARSVQN